MATYLYLLNEQIELDDQVFFTSVELFNRYLMCSTMEILRSSTGEELDAFKAKCRRRKALLATGCFHLSTKICHRSIDSIRLIEFNPNSFTREDLLEIEIEILDAIRYEFPRRTPHLFIAFFLRYLSQSIDRLFTPSHSISFLDEQQKMSIEHLYRASMLLLVHIYLQWTSIAEFLAKKENGSTTINQHQMESVNQRLRDPLLVGSATILAASKMFFSHGTNSHLHDKVKRAFFSLSRVIKDRFRLSISSSVCWESTRCESTWRNSLPNKSCRSLFREDSFRVRDRRTIASPRFSSIANTISMMNRLSHFHLLRLSCFDYKEIHRNWPSSWFMSMYEQFFHFLDKTVDLEVFHSHSDAAPAVDIILRGVRDCALVMKWRNRHLCMRVWFCLFSFLLVFNILAKIPREWLRISCR